MEDRRSLGGYGLCRSLKSIYKFVQNIIKKEEFGKRRIDKVRLSDAKC